MHWAMAGLWGEERVRSGRRRADGGGGGGGVGHWAGLRGGGGAGRPGRRGPARPAPNPLAPTLLDFPLALCQLLEVADDSAGRQVMEGLAPQVGVARAAPLGPGGPQLEAHLPLQKLAAAQALDHGLAQHGDWGGLLLGLGQGLPVRRRLALKGRGVMGRPCGRRDKRTLL